SARMVNDDTRTANNLGQARVQKILPQDRQTLAETWTQGRTIPFLTGKLKKSRHPRKSTL
ncbi:MAG TPA: hypothetical protein VM120_18905, partial [Bryobacteraceae bacterium]|nr:hypothetical protein [Bryobacteraceae bacterium]